MAKYRTIQPEFWSDPYIEGLHGFGKLLYLYMITSLYTQNAGVLKVTTKKIGFETGASVEIVEDTLDKFEQDGKIVRDGALIWIVNFIKNQTNTSPKIIAGLREEIKDIESEKILSAMRARYPHLFDTDGASNSDTLSIPYPHPTDTPYIPSGEKELELESKREKELESEKELENEGERETEGEREEEKEKTLSMSNDILVPVPRGQPPCPCEDIAEAYNTLLPELLPVQKLTEARKRTLRARWREDKERQSISWWIGFWENVKRSDWLMGRCPPTRGRDSPWQADFDWLLKPTNLQKVLEGKYRNKPDVFEQAIANGYGGSLRSVIDAEVT